MTVLEKAAYLKGLAEGLNLDTETKEGKLISAIIDTLADIADELDELNKSTINLGEEIDALSDDLADVEEVVFGDEDDDEEDDEDGCCCEDDYCCVDDECTYEVTCPSCGEDVVINESDLEAGEISCPKCGEKLEFEFDEDFEEDKDEDKKEEND